MSTGVCGCGFGCVHVFQLCTCGCVFHAFVGLCVSGVCARVCGCVFWECVRMCVSFRCVCVWLCVWGVGVHLCVCCFQAHFRAGRGPRRGKCNPAARWAVRPCPFPTNQMQISINSINGQCLLAIKIAQRLLVSGSKMDGQWPRRSQRSKMTITLKCNLCRPPASGPAGGGRAASHLQPHANGPARPSSRQMAPGHHGLCHLSAHCPKP